MIRIEPTFKRFGMTYATQVPIAPVKKVESYVTSVAPTGVENVAGKFSKLREKAKALMQKEGISFDEALKKLQSREGTGQLIDIWA